jgi:hypothetical protein
MNEMSKFIMFRNEEENWFDLYKLSEIKRIEFSSKNKDSFDVYFNGGRVIYTMKERLDFLCIYSFLGEKSAWNGTTFMVEVNERFPGQRHEV